MPRPDLQQGVKALLSARDCGEFVEGLINKLAETTKNDFISDYVPDLFDGVTVDFSQRYMSDGTTKVAGRAYPRDASGMGKLGMSPKDARNLTDLGYKNAVYSYVETYLHELIHFAGSKGRYNDRDVVDAIVAMGNLPKGAIDEHKRIDPGSPGANSRFFDDLLQYHCPGPEGRPTWRR